MSATLRERALRLLARREHARADLGRKLAPYAEDVDQLETLLDDLIVRQLLSDERYAEMRVNSRSARYGNVRLVNELRILGVAEEVVAQTMATTGAGDSELSRARRVWQRRFDRLPDVSDLAERARQMRFLLSRGFSGETVRHVLRGDFEDE